MRALLVLLLVVGAGGAGWYFLQGEPAVTPAGAGAAAEGAGRAAPLEGMGADTHDGKPAGDPARDVVAGTDPKPGESFAVRGRLVFVDGTPVGDVSFGVRQDVGLDGATGLPIPASREAFDAAWQGTGTTDRGGVFEIGVPAKGRYRLRVSDESLVLTGESVRGHAFQVQQARVELGDVRVDRAASIVGQVVSGGVGVADVEVVMGQGGALSMLLGARTKTDAEGCFTLKQVHPGEVRLSTRSPEYLPARQTVQVAAGEARTGLVIELEVGGVIAGTVLDDLGAPVAGADVTAARHRQLESGMTFKGFRSGESVETDASGRFRLAGLAQQAAQLRATKAGHAAAEMSEVAVGRSDVVLRLQRFGSIAGGLVDEQGAPIAGSEVTAAPAQGRGMMMLLRDGAPVRTDADGRFVVTDVRPGRNRVVASGAGHLDATAFAQVAAGQAVTEVQLEARRGATLTVTVVDHEGEPVADAAVVVRSPAPQRRAGPAGSRRIERRVRRRAGGDRSVTIDSGAQEAWGAGQTDAAGIAVIRGLPAGEAEVRATHRALAMATPVAVTLPDGGAANCRLTMQLGGFVEITAVDGAGEPLVGAGFEVAGPIVGDVAGAETQAHKTGGEGTARVGPLRPGAYRALLQQAPKVRKLGDEMSFSIAGDANTLADSEARFAIQPEATATAKLVMPVLTTVRGSVRDADGPVAGAEVDLTAEGEMRIPFAGKNRVKTDAEGRFEITGMPSGKYTLTYGRRDAVVPAEKAIVLATNQALHEEDLTLPGGIIKLRVTDAGEGFGIEEAAVSLQRVQPKAAPGEPAPRRPRARIMMVSMTAGGSGGPSSFQMTTGSKGIQTDAEGRAVIRGVPPGSYDLRVRHADYAKVHRVVVMGRDQTRDLGEIKVAEGAKIRGKIEWADPPELALATVEVATLDGKNPETEIAQGLRFKFSGLAPGVYRVRARPVSTTEWGPAETVEVRAGDTGRVTLRIGSK